MSRDFCALSAAAARPAAQVVATSKATSRSTPESGFITCLARSITGRRKSALSTGAVVLQRERGTRGRLAQGEAMTDTSQWPAAPVYSPRDYALILKLSEVGDLPPTWEEWWENFKASESEQRRQGFPAIRVSVHAGKFKAWLQDNSLSSSEQTRQQFTQQRLDMKRERKAARLAAELPFGERLWAPAPPPPPAPWSHRAIETCALILLVIAVSSAMVVGGTLATSSPDLPFFH